MWRYCKGRRPTQPEDRNGDPGAGTRRDRHPTLRPGYTRGEAKVVLYITAWSLENHKQYTRKLY